MLGRLLECREADVHRLFNNSPADVITYMWCTLESYSAHARAHTEITRKSIKERQLSRRAANKPRVCRYIGCPIITCRDKERERKRAKSSILLRHYSHSKALNCSWRILTARPKLISGNSVWLLWSWFCASRLSSSIYFDLLCQHWLWYLDVYILIQSFSMIPIFQRRSAVFDGIKLQSRYDFPLSVVNISLSIELRFIGIM